MITRPTPLWLLTDRDRLRSGVVAALNEVPSERFERCPRSCPRDRTLAVADPQRWCSVLVEHESVAGVFSFRPLGQQPFDPAAGCRCVDPGVESEPSRDLKLGVRLDTNVRARSKALDAPDVLTIDGTRNWRLFGSRPEWVHVAVDEPDDSGMVLRLIRAHHELDRLPRGDAEPIAVTHELHARQRA